MCIRDSAGIAVAMARLAAARLVRMQIIGALRRALRSIRELTVLPQVPPGLPSADSSDSLKHCGARLKLIYAIVDSRERAERPRREI